MLGVKLLPAAGKVNKGEEEGKCIFAATLTDSLRSCLFLFQSFALSGSDWLTVGGDKLQSGGVSVWYQSCTYVLNPLTHSILTWARGKGFVSRNDVVFLTVSLIPLFY